MERLTKRWGEQPYPNLAGKVICEYKECDSAKNCNDCVHGRIAQRLAAYEDTGLEPEEIDLMAKQRDLYVDACGGLPLKRVRELAQADREGRVHIYGKSHKCPICGAYRLVPRVDGQFYFCFHCKNQVTRAEAEAALRREQE